MNTVIRKMTYDDLPQVMEVEKQCFSDPWGEESFYQEIELNGSFVAVNADNRVIAYFCGIKVLDEYMLTNIAVAPDYRRMGLGEELVDYMLKDISESGSRLCFLEVRKSNSAAINLYLKKGFLPFGERKNYYQNPVENAVMMKRIL